MLEVKAFKHEQDYPLLVEWWKAWKHHTPPMDELPPTGLMVYEYDKPIFCAFLVLTNTKYAYVETGAANPTTTWQKREECIEALEHAFSTIAKDMGYRRLLCLVHKPKLVQKIFKTGAKMDARPTFLLVKELKDE